MIFKFKPKILSLFQKEVSPTSVSSLLALVIIKAIPLDNRWEYVWSSWLFACFWILLTFFVLRCIFQDVYLEDEQTCMYLLYCHPYTVSFPDSTIPTAFNITC